MTEEVEAAVVNEKAGSSGDREASIRVASVEVRYGEDLALAHVVDL